MRERDYHFEHSLSSLLGDWHAFGKHSPEQYRSRSASLSLSVSLPLSVLLYLISFRWRWWYCSCCWYQRSIEHILVFCLRRPGPWEAFSPLQKWMTQKYQKACQSVSGPFIWHRAKLTAQKRRGEEKRGEERAVVLTTLCVLILIGWLGLCFLPLGCPAFPAAHVSTQGTLLNAEHRPSLRH